MKATYIINVIGNQLNQLIFQLDNEYIYMQGLGLFDGLIF